MNAIKIIPTLLFCLAIMACNSNIMKLEKKLSSDESPTRVVNVPVVEKRFVKKNGEITDIKEFYLQMSIQDYFIKFCESKVTEEELRERLAKDNSLIKSIPMEVEFKDGEWDRCGEEEVQSRIGAYVIVHKLITPGR